jgi:hypothetical protein
MEKRGKYKRTKEHKLKMSNVQKINQNLPLVKKKKSEALKISQNKPEVKLKIGNVHRGKIISKETRMKKSLAAKKYAAKHPEVAQRVNPNNFSEKTIQQWKKNLRIGAIKRIERQKFNGYPLKICVGKNEKLILDNIEKVLNYKIERQYPIIGYFIDGYIPELKIAFEIDEYYHCKNNNLRQKDIQRQQEIEKELNCQFIRIKDIY